MKALLAAAAVAILLAPMGLSQAAPANQPLAAPEWTAYAAREDIASAGDLAGAHRVLRFVQVSDAHILDDDAPFPLRAESLDALGPPFTAAQRPQEEYTDEVLDSLVRAINAQHAVDPFQFVLNTGDNIDNALENELTRFIDVYDGTTTTRGPISGFDCIPDGQSASVQDPSQDVRTACTSLPATLAANHTGLAAGLPWYSAFGNHDGLVQGNVGVASSSQAVAQQAGRRFLLQPEYVAMHFPGADACPGEPGGSVSDDFGHGFGFAGNRLCDDDADNDSYYAFSLQGVRFIVLDTLSDDVSAGNGLPPGFDPQSLVGAGALAGQDQGAIDPAQAEWMAAEIAAHPGELKLIVSHHPVNSLFSSRTEGSCSFLGCLDDALQEAGYKTGPQFIDELAATPSVAGWLGGHTHDNRLQPKLAGDGGFWNLESASLIDWPQEARVIELWVTADGGKGFWRLSSFTHDVESSRAMEFTDPQRQAAADEPGDRDAILWFDVPIGVTLQPLPEVERAVRLRLVASGTPLEASDPPALPPLQSGVQSSLTVQAIDALTGLGVAGLAMTWAVAHDPAACESTSNEPVVDLPAGTPLRDVGGGIYVGEFTPSRSGTYYPEIRSPAMSPFTAASQVVRVLVEGDDGCPVEEAPAPAQGEDGPPANPGREVPIPGPGLALALAVLAFTLLVARRRS
ncbi:MAG: metallophosphoesterase [Candidatus Thermoplasmatota archaeon]|jgi:hypothetical protein